MNMVKPEEVYTPKEAQEILKISSSTLKRLIKKGLIRANKIGGQYRIVGHEILRILSPAIDEKATNLYQRLKRKTKQLLNE